MPVELLDCEQRSEEWYQARLGIATASNFKSVLAKGEGKTRLAYMRRLAAEIITGEPGETFESAAMVRGREMEAEARDFYTFMKDAEPVPVGFIRNGQKGCSPDSLLGDDGMLEIKTQRADLLIATILKDDFPPEHMHQCQGQLWVAEREWLDLVVYWPSMPLFVKRITRDPTHIGVLDSAVTTFNADLAEMVGKVKAFEKGPGN